MASELEKEERDSLLEWRKLKIGQYRFAPKTDEEYQLADQIVKIVDRLAEEDLRLLEAEVADFT